jgi:hypothetical protein
MRRILSMLVLCAAFASPLAAQAHPDLSGKWSLDPKSAPAGMPAGATIVITVKQDEKTINIDMVAANTPMGEQKRTTVANLDGTPTKNTVTTPAGAMELTSTASWEGPALTVMTSGDLQGYAVVQTDKWSLGADKKTLDLETTVSMAGQKQTSKLSFIKQ